MSFTDQKQRIATEHECNNWGGRREGGKRFRCYMCGHKFEPGDKWRWVIGTKIGLINFLVCDSCDGEDVLERWKAQNDEIDKKYWWLLPKDDYHSDGTLW
jgi:hypothetical protein